MLVIVGVLSYDVGNRWVLSHDVGNSGVLTHDVGNSWGFEP